MSSEKDIRSRVESLGVNFQVIKPIKTSFQGIKRICLNPIDPVCQDRRAMRPPGLKFQLFPNIPDTYSLRPI